MRPTPDAAVVVRFETIVEPGYSLKRMSVRQYVSDARFGVLGVASAPGRGPVRFFWNGASRAEDNLDAGYQLLKRERERGSVMIAHNALFDAMVAERQFGLRFARIFDTAAYARYLGLGSTLASLARWMQIEKGDAPPFSRASLDCPHLLATMARYCMTDAAICRKAFNRATDDEVFPDAEFDLINHAIQLNLRGVRLCAEQIDTYLTTLRQRRDQELMAFTKQFDFDTSDFGRPSKVLAFLRGSLGVEMSSLDRRKDDYARAIEAGGNAATFLIRRARIDSLSQAIAKGIKYSNIMGGRVHGVLRYYGAHTGRFSSGGRDGEGLNMHGLRKAAAALSLPEMGLERRLIVPEPGQMFCACDLSTVEARILAWLAGEEELLARFRAGEDIYAWFASLIFPGVVITKNGPNAHLRKLGKEAVLGLGFGMGLETFRRKVREKQIACTDQDVNHAFQTYRDSFKRIEALRKTLMRTLLEVTEGRTSHPTRLWRIYTTEYEGVSAPTIAIRLPTERTLFYRSVRALEEWSDQGSREAVWFAPSFGGKGNDLPTEKRRAVRRCSDGIVRKRITPSLLVENVAQAIARDVMAHQVLELESRGMRVAWHAHDEIIVSCPACACASSCSAECSWSRSGAALLAVMSRVPKTLPALAELPLAAELDRGVRHTYGG